MSVWDRVRQLIRTARGLTAPPRRLISGLSRLGAAPVTPTIPRAPLVKFTLTHREPVGGTGSAEVLEVSPPPRLYDRWVEDGAPEEHDLAAWLRERFFGGVGFVRILGAEDHATEAPTAPRLSLPRALPELRADPTLAAIRGLKLVGGRARPFYGNLRLDLDDVAPNPRAVARWAREHGLRRAFEWRPSASGKGTHVKFRIREGVAPRAAFALRLALGDDPIRTAIDESRYAYHGRSSIGGVLFDRKGDARAGPWRSSRKSVTDERTGGTRVRAKPSGPSRAPRGSGSSQVRKGRGMRSGSAAERGRPRKRTRSSA